MSTIKTFLTSEQDLNIQMDDLPSCAGVYQFYDRKGTLLYVGKAKNLKKRIVSYFVKKHSSTKTAILVKKIKSIKHIVVDTETDALLLENNLIKQYKPRYNVLLKDDKTYPWICIKKEHFPRIFLTRKVIRDDSEYFGPYPSVRKAKVLLDLIQELYPIRSCSLDLSQKNIKKRKYKVCLDYHIGNCKGPCEAYQTREDYGQMIKSIREIIKGNFKQAVFFFEKQMMNFAAEQAFENAQQIKEKLKLLKDYQSRSMVVHPSIHNVDVFSIVSDEDFAYINFLKILNGAIIQSYTQEIKKKMQESDTYLLSLSILELRRRFESNSKEIYVPFNVKVSEGIKVIVPKIGDKKHIVELSKRNARYHQKERLNQMQIIEHKVNNTRILKQMKRDLQLLELPKHIECFDNSNIQGTNPVAACVVFKNAKPVKKLYRHFHIKTVTGPNDFASMEEIVYRRYYRLLREKQPLPQLILVDGGKGQLSSALKSLEILGLRGKIAVIGIAKRLEEIYYPDDSVPRYLKKKSITLKVLQHLRDEAHRFGLTFHRNQRSKKAIHTELENIKGIGTKTIEKLLNHYKSVENIKKNNLEDLKSVINKSQALAIIEYFK